MQKWSTIAENLVMSNYANFFYIENLQTFLLFLPFD